MRDSFKQLRASVPYIQIYRGKLFVVKVGGELLENPLVRDQILEQLGLLHSMGIQVVLVHGGALQIANLCERLGLPVEKVDGRRITSPAVLETVQMVLAGKLQTDLLAAARRLGLPAAGISGISGGLIQAVRRSPESQGATGDGPLIDYGEVGRITAVQPALLQQLCMAGYLPLVAPLGCSAEGAVLNINADTVAAVLAVALGAAKLVFLMQPPGILAQPDDHSTLIPELDRAELSALTSTGALMGGMLPKAAATEQALAGGVPCVHFVSGALPDALLAEVFTNEGSGTMVVRGE